MRTQSVPRSQQPLWHQLAPCYSSEPERLAAYLALETSEVLAGVKPANLLRIPKQRLKPEYDFYQSWQRYGRELLQKIGLQVEIMAERKNGLLLLIYHPQALQSLLARPNVKAFLRRANYPDSSDLNSTLKQLKAGVSNTDFPHEIGVFLGYPLKDVAGFMGWVNLPNSGQALWKFYGNPERSLKLAQTFRNCRHRMAKQLENCCTPFDCLRCEYLNQSDAFLALN